jgi:hypothetical protein
MTVTQVLSERPKSSGARRKPGRAKGKASKKANRSPVSQTHGRRTSKKEVSAKPAVAKKRKSDKKNTKKSKG